jgi:2-oxoglutarate dehydrogenase E1 component
MVERVRAELDAAQKEALELEKAPPMRRMPRYWEAYRGGRYERLWKWIREWRRNRSRAIGEALTSYPEGFHIHPKVKKLLEQRVEMAQGKRALDYGMAEALAFGSLLKQGVPVRLSGQDSAARHVQPAPCGADRYRDGARIRSAGAPRAGSGVVRNLQFAAFRRLRAGLRVRLQPRFPEALVLWEAQFGDFANGAQIIIDQFIAASEDKWNLLSGVVMLLPHGYEGQGPEHSSARIERFLHLAARDNIQICQPSTAAQYFHLLRRQALRAWRKPLVVFTPKSMLRNPAASSSPRGSGRGRDFRT